MKNLQSLRTELDQELARISKTVDEFDWANSKHYADWLVQTYYYASHATRLMAFSASRLRQKQNKLHLRCVEQMKEGRAHEILALNDLRHLGFKIFDFSELPETMALYQTQYDLNENVNPIALFGYILFLEGHGWAKGREIFKKVSSAFGVKTATFWKVYSEEDKGRIENAFEELEDCSAEELQIVSQSLETSSRHYEKMLRSISERQAEDRPVDPHRYERTNPKPRSR